jgi:hypothetical protein
MGIVAFTHTTDAVSTDKMVAIVLENDSDSVFVNGDVTLAITIDTTTSTDGLL